MESKKTIVRFLTIVIVVLLGFAVSLFFYSNNDNSDNSPSNTQQLSTGNSWYENFYDKPITDKNIALNAIEANRDRLGYNNENISFEFMREDKYLGSSYRFKTLYKQIPIYSSTINVTTHADNRPNVIISGSIDLSKLEKLNTTPKITQDEALNIAKEALGENFSQYNILKKKIYPKLIIYETNGEYVLTYYINTRTYVCVINAENGDIVKSQSTLCYNVAEYKGQNGDNQQIFYDDYSDESVNIKNALWNKEENIFITDNLIKTMTLEDIQSGKNKSAVDAMANTYKSVDYFKKFFQIFFDTTMVTINYEKGKYDASGAGGVDEDGTFAFLYFKTKTNKKEVQDSAYLDDVAHEYTHAITDLKAFGSNGYSEDNRYFERNALMEAYSDIFGQLIEYEYTGKTDWKQSDTNRNLKNPKIKKYSKRNIINDIGTDKNDYGGAHENSTIISHTAYLMSKNNDNKSYNAEFLLDFNQLGKLWYGSLYYIDENSYFSDCRLAIEQSANNLIEDGVLLEANLDIIKQAFDEVEVTTEPARHGLKDALKVADNQNNSIAITQETTQHEDDISIEIKTEASTEPETIAEKPEYGEYNNLRYSLFRNEITITGCNDKSATNIEIPSEIYGFPVTIIGYCAFKDCDLTSIIIPNSVKTIGYRAFESCNNLIDITIPDSVVKIEYNPFQDTPWLNKKREENSLVIVNSILIDGKICNGDVVIPENVTQIGDGAFSGSNINSITIPDSIISIGDCAFDSCNNLLSIIIPKNVKVCRTETFNCCENLKEITFLNPECEINLQYIGQGMCKNGVIKGYENSTAQEYVERYGYEFKALED